MALQGLRKQGGGVSWLHATPTRHAALARTRTTQRRSQSCSGVRRESGALKRHLLKLAAVHAGRRTAGAQVCLDSHNQLAIRSIQHRLQLGFFVCVVYNSCDTRRSCERHDPKLCFLLALTPTAQVLAFSGTSSATERSCLHE